MIESPRDAIAPSPPGAPLATEEWALARSRALYPDLSEATLREIVGMAGKGGKAAPKAKGAR